MVRVKICGITCREDAEAALEAGADALGFIFARSPRRISPEDAREIIVTLPPLVSKVGVFVEEPLERLAEIRAYCGLDLVQLHGGSQTYGESLGSALIKPFAMGKGAAPSPDQAPKALLLLDTHVPGLAGGTGKTFDWKLAAPLAAQRRVILAGGLNPDNVAKAIRTVKPFAVDVCSGVEKSPGRKDHERVAEFVKNAKLA